MEQDRETKARGGGGYGGIVGSRFSFNIKNLIALQVNRIIGNLQQVQVFDYFSYLWLNNKALLLSTFLFNYIIPFLLDFVFPWWTSKRKVGNKFRTARIKVVHNLVTSKDFEMKLIKDFFFRGLLYAFIESTMKWVKKYIFEQNKIAVRRLVMERVLFGEVDVFRRIKGKDRLERKVFGEIIENLKFFIQFLPDLLLGVYGFYQESTRLYKKRAKIDWLAPLYPIVIAITHRIIVWIKDSKYTKKKKKETKIHKKELNTYIGDTIQRLIDIQTNNLQQTQLTAFDTTCANQLTTKHGVWNFPLGPFIKLKEMSLFSYILEIWCVHKIMKKQNMNHGEFSKIQQEIEHLIGIGRKLLHLVRDGVRIYNHQDKLVKQWSNIPNWKTTDRNLYSLADIAAMSKGKKIDPSKLHRLLSPNDFTLRSVVFSGVTFSYDSEMDIPMSGYVPPLLYLNEDLKFEPSHRYGFVGGQAGRVIGLLLTKIYTPLSGKIYLNGIEYDMISRTALRDIISYTTEDPFICDGTIRENLLLFNPNATETELCNAIKYSGLYHFLGDNKSHIPDLTISEPSSANPFQQKNKKTKKISSPKKTTITSTSYEDLEKLGKKAILKSTSSFGDLTSLDIHGNPGPFSEENIRFLDESTEEDLGVSEFTANSTDESSDSKDTVVSEGMLRVFSSPDLIEEENRKRRTDSFGFMERADFGNEDTASLRFSEDQLKEMLNEGVSREMPKPFAQAIGLARIFLKSKAKIIILDKALNDMDQKKLSRDVFPHLFQFIRDNNMCLLCVSPNITLLRELDTIVVFDQGTVVHQGSHKQLVKQNAPKYMEEMFPWKTTNLN